MRMGFREIFKSALPAEQTLLCPTDEAANSKTYPGGLYYDNPFTTDRVGGIFGIFSEGKSGARPFRLTSS